MNNIGAIGTASVNKQHNFVSPYTDFKCKCGCFIIFSLEKWRGINSGSQFCPKGVYEGREHKPHFKIIL